MFTRVGEMERASEAAEVEEEELDMKLEAVDDANDDDEGDDDINGGGTRHVQRAWRFDLFLDVAIVASASQVSDCNSCPKIK